MFHPQRFSRLTPSGTGLHPKKRKKKHDGRLFTQRKHVAMSSTQRTHATPHCASPGHHFILYVDVDVNVNMNNRTGQGLPRGRGGHFVDATGATMAAIVAGLWSVSHDIQIRWEIVAADQWPILTDFRFARMFCACYCFIGAILTLADVLRDFVYTISCGVRFVIPDQSKYILYTRMCENNRFYYITYEEYKIQVLT